MFSCCLSRLTTLFAYLELKLLSCCMFRVIITIFVYFNFEAHFVVFSKP